MRSLAVAVCAVAVHLIGSDVQAQVFFSEAHIGAHGGVEVTRRDLRDWRIGGQMSVGIFGPVDFAAGYQVFLSDRLRTQTLGNEEESEGWLSARVSPFGKGWYVGIGAALMTAGFDRSQVPRTTEWLVVLETGVEGNVGPLRPFATLQLLDPLSHGLGGINTGTSGALSIKLAKFYVVMVGTNFRIWRRSTP